MLKIMSLGRAWYSRSVLSLLSPFLQFPLPPSLLQQRSIPDGFETSLKEMESIRVGMTRIGLLKAFEGGGGISTRLSRRYVYRDCSYIIVDVEFEPLSQPNSFEGPQDKIVQISKPFLERPIED
jgi:hypothetical protein